MLPSSAQLSEILPLGPIAEVKELAVGIQNYVFLLDSPLGKHCLRMHKFRGREHVSYEVKLLSLLRGEKVPQLVRDREGFIFMVGDRPATLYPFIAGKHLTEFSADQLAAVGVWLARFHNKSAGFVWEKERFEFYNLPDEVIEKYRLFVLDQQLSYCELLPSIISDLRLFRLSSELPQGAIHVDIGPKNVLFHDGELSAVIDFDNSFVGPLILDLGKAVMFFASRAGGFSPEMARSICRAYRAERLLTSSEEKHIYDAIAFAFLSHVFVDYYMFATQVTPRSYFEYIVNDLYVSYRSFRAQCKSNADLF